MRMRLLVLLAMIALLLSSCGYMVVEDAPVQVGSAHLQGEVSHERAE